MLLFRLKVTSRKLMIFLFGKNAHTAKLPRFVAKNLITQDIVMR